MNETANLLHIIAGEIGRLSPSDRDIIRGSAEELDRAYHGWALANAALIEAQQQVIAQHDRIIELQRAAQPVQPIAPILSMGTGWVKVQGYL